MSHRRDFLRDTLRGTTLLSVGTVVPGFVAGTALAADPAAPATAVHNKGTKNTVLVVVELSGGNDGLNTVIPFADDLYHKYRPTLRKTQDRVIKVDAHIGLNPALSGLGQLLGEKKVAIVQGVGYPNPDRSHFESSDIWQSADTRRLLQSGWLARSVPTLQDIKGNIPALQVGDERLPLALQGAAGGVVSLNGKDGLKLELGEDAKRAAARRSLLESLAQKPDHPADRDTLAAFVRRRQVQTYGSIDKLKDALTAGQKKPGQDGQGSDVVPAITVAGLDPNASKFSARLDLIADLIAKDFGTRVYYVSHDGFDTHSGQAPVQDRLLGELAGGINHLFTKLGQTGHADRVLLMTFSEFGRRVQENGSRGTDHGAASCMFVVGPAAAGGAVGPHPRLDDLDSGDLKHHTDFRQVYATLLDQWLGCDSAAVLGGRFAHIPLLKAKG